MEREENYKKNETSTLYLKAAGVQEALPSIS